MKKLILIGCLLLAAGQIIHAQQNDFPKLAGSYFGQKPPGKVPEPFAASIFDPSYASYHTNINFSPDGQEAYWSQDNTRRRANPNDPIIKGICVSKIENGHWTKPKIASFSPPNISDAPFISPDGKKLYFITTRPIEKQGKSGGEAIWYVDKSSDGWSEPKPLPPAINSMERIHWSFSVDNRGNIYFGALSGIYCSKYEKGEYQRSEELDVTINKPGVGNSCPFISPDRSYLIFTRWENKTSRLLISFRNQDGSWSSPKEINSVIEMNEEHGQICPYVSPDGKYFFFLDTVGDGINIRLDIRPYWVGAGFIEELRPKK